MNDELEQFAREYLKNGLSQCTKKEQDIFRRMYAHGEPDIAINDVVGKMEVEKLDWAMQQVDRTLAKRAWYGHRDDGCNWEYPK